MTENAFRYNPANPIILDFRGCKNIDELHLRIKETFGFPDYYGKNWDAMWDCIDGYFYQETCRIIEIQGFYSMPQELQEYCEPMWEIFRDLKAKQQNVEARIIS